MTETVLFLDDEPAILEGFARLLRKEPYTVLTATSGVAALAVLGRQPIDVVVSDERMPGMSGSEFLEQVRSQYPRIIRIMLTGQARLEVATRAIQQGLYRFLSKPIDPDDLRRTIRQALQMKQLADKSAQIHLRP